MDVSSLFTQDFVVVAAFVGGLMQALKIGVGEFRPAWREWWVVKWGLRLAPMALGSLVGHLYGLGPTLGGVAGLAADKAYQLIGPTLPDAVQGRRKAEGVPRA